MPTLEFKGKQHIYAHYLTISYHVLIVETILVPRLPTIISVRNQNQTYSVMFFKMVDTLFGFAV